MYASLNKNGGGSRRPQSRRRWAGGLIAALSLLCGPALHADAPVTMAPPVNPPITQPQMAPPVGTAPNVSQDSVFNWSDVPQNQQVPLTGATFDQGGYQLYDTVGETIVVPFASQNLYVMKFAVSPNDTLYFVNTGSAPVLYVPRGSYLENATVPGAKWYPFSEKFHPAAPVFLGIAPSYSAFVGLGWYPSTIVYGGYYGHTSFVTGGLFLPTVGLTFFVGRHPYYGYSAYHDYVFLHPAPYHVGYFNRGFYRFAGRPVGPGHVFYGGRGNYAAHGFGGGGHVFRGVGSFGGGRTAHAHRTFRGSPSYGGGRPYGAGRSYGGHSTVRGGFSGGHRGR